MKISASQYAQALYESLGDKKETEAKKIIAKLVEFLALQGDLAKGKEIVVRFEEIWQKEKSELAATAESARELSGATKKMLLEYLEARSGRKNITLSEKINPALLGGAILRYDNRLVDMSVKNVLANLKTNLKKD